MDRIRLPSCFLQSYPVLAELTVPQARRLRGAAEALPHPYTLLPEQAKSPRRIQKRHAHQPLPQLALQPFSANLKREPPACQNFAVIARVIRPLPQIPIPPARLLPRPTGVRKLPSLPPRSQSTSQLSQQLPYRSSLPNPLAISATDSLDRHDSKPKSWDPGYFAPEIDWDAIMVEIIRGNSRENSDYYDYTDDAESIYTDFVYEE
ncbi:hypothetical protein EV359DRAFT_83017 [Lentinula novae-zelandiae]|nr:hypothetical protein EV359DRAFT_83017 [Lentinula novae-zelandiae]